MRKGWNEIAAVWHFAGPWLPRITLDTWNVCSGENASVYEELRFHNGRIDSVGTGLQHLTLHINLNPSGYNGRASNERTALYRYFLLQNLFGNPFGTEVFKNGTPSGIIKCSWLSFRKVFSFDFVFGVFWYPRNLNKYDGDLLTAIFAIIVRDAFGLSFGSATEDAVFSFVSPDMHLLSEHSLEEIAAEQYLLFEGWLERLKPDLDPRFVNHLWISTVVWISTFAGFLLCLLGIELKNRICRWWYHRPGRCRLCARRRLTPCRKPHAPRSIQRLILFGWLLISSHAFEPLRNFCEIDNVSTLSRDKIRDSKHYGRSESRTTEYDAPPEHGQANLDPGHSLSDNEIVPNMFLNWSEHWSDFCASTGSLICIETGSVAYHEGTDAAAPSRSDPSVRQEITFEVENTDQSGDPIEDGICFMQAPVLGRGETCGIHIDPLVYWDRLAFRPPIISNRFYVWKTNPYRVGMLQQQLFQIPWDGQSCIRCATAAVTDFAETNIMCGPYYIRPQPEPIDGVPTLQFLLTTAPKLVMQRAIHIKVQTDQGTRQGTMVLNTLTGIIGIPVIFDSALPSNRCRTTSWCRVTKRFPGPYSIRWWPDNILLDDYTHLEIAEFDSQPAYLQTVVALPPTQAFVCQQSNTDPGSTSYEDDHTSLFALKTSLAHEDDIFSLMHAPNFDADRSHSDDSETSRTSSSPSMQTSNRMHEDDADSLEDSDALLVFGRHLEPELVPIGPQTPVDMHRLSVAQHFGISQSPGESDSLSIYYIRPRPEDLAQCIIPILATFKNERTLDTSIVLVDIELRSNKPRACDSSPEEPYTLRETWFVPVVLTRAAFIHWIGFKELCKQVALPCITQYGYHAWFQQDVTPMPIPDGIMLRIIVPIPNPDIPMPFYVDYSRANIPFDQMHAHFLQQQRQAALRVAELFPTDDEMVSQAAQSAPAQNDGTDFASLAQISKKLAPVTMPEDPDLALGDAHCLMMNAPLSVTPSLRRQILVIYEYDFPPTTTSIDPSLPLAQFRHAIGTLMEIESALDWDNFLVLPVRPRPPHIDPLTHESYLLIMPQQIRPGCVHLVVRLQLYWEYDDCLRTEEHSEVKVKIFAQWLDRESFLAHAHFRDLCSLSGRDKSVIHVAGQLWQPIDFESRFLFDGMFATIRCPSTVRTIPLSEQIQRARVGWPNNANFANYPVPDGREGFSLFQTKMTMQPFRAPDVGLPPPGNGKLDALDKVVTISTGQTMIVDWEDTESNPRPICLADLLPIPTPLGRRKVPLPHACFEKESALTHAVKEASCQHQFGSQTPLYDDFLAFDAFHEKLETTLPKNMTCPEDILQWKESLPCVDWPSWNPADVEEFRFYTDGSFDGMTSSWAFCCLVRHKDEWSFLGHQYGLTVPFERMKRDHSALVGEFQALLWSGSWTLRLARLVSWEGCVTFCWDSIVAGLKADGDFVATCDFLSEAVRHIFQGLEALLGTEKVRHKHVRAHTGICPNEYADCLAKHALKQGIAPPEQTAALQTLLDCPNASLQWLWWHLRGETDAERNLDSLPRYRDGRIEWEPRADIFVDAAQVVHTSIFPAHERVTSEAACLNFTLQIGTYNCLSLGPSDCDSAPHGLKGIGRVALVRKEASRLGFHILGIQEARSSTGTVRSSTHLRICSGKPTDGTLGIELWIALDKPYCFDESGHPVHFFPHEFAVVFGDPRLLVVACQSKRLETHFVIGHAPHSGTTDEIRSHWWQQVDDKLKQAGVTEFVCMFNANARVAAPSDANFGDIADGHKDHVAEHLRAFASTFDLFAPATFSTCHEGPIATWVHPAHQTPSRIDYILLPRGWHTARIWSWTEPQLHSGHLVVDHICAAVYLEWSAWTHRTVHCGRRYDRSQVADPANHEAVKDIISGIPEVAWQVNATQHVAEITDYLQQSLAQHFPLSTKRGKPTIASEDAQQCFDLLTKAKRQLRYYYEIRRNLVLRLVFQCWRDPNSEQHSSLWLGQFFRTHALLSKEVPALAKRLRVTLRTERIEYITQVAQKASDAPAREVFRLLRPVLKPRRQQRDPVQPLPQVLKLDGTLTHNVTELCSRWEEHFSLLEAGTPQDPISMTQEVVDRQQHVCRGRVGWQGHPHVVCSGKCTAKSQNGQGPWSGCPCPWLVQSHPKNFCHQALPGSSQTMLAHWRGCLLQRRQTCQHL